MTKEQFIKYLQGRCTEQEFEQIMDWIKEGATDSFDQKMAEEVWNDFEPGEPAESLKYNQLLEKIHQQIEYREKAHPVKIPGISTRERILTLLTRVAAILFLPVLSILLYTTFSDKGSYKVNTSELEVEAPAGSRMNFVLGDGTRVWLNHGGKLKYPYQFDGKERKVQLTGEAYFEIAHNQEIPFIVETDHFDVKATGTEFNVSAYPDDEMQSTTLVEGKVFIYSKDDHKELKELSPNQSLLYSGETAKYQLENGNIEKYVAWKNGLLIFKNDEITNIARKLAKWYNVDVEIMDEKAKGYTCTATFTDETLGQVLELMSLPTPVYFKLLPRKKASDGSFAKQKVLIGLKENMHIKMKSPKSMDK